MKHKLDGNTWQLIYLMPSEWVWRSVWKEDWDPQAAPAAGQWMPAIVPGDVISDALDARLIDSPYVDMQSRQAEWLSERDWVYRRTFELPADMRGRHTRLCFDGVDFTCHVYLNGEFLGKHEGMFTHFDFDISEHVRADMPNTLTVVVEHMPPVESVQGQIGWSSEARLWKSRFAYNWDWCTRLVPLGIWQSVYLTATAEDYLQDVWVRTHIQGENATVDVQAQIRSAVPVEHTTTTRCRLYSPAGDLLADSDGVAASVYGGNGTASIHLDVAEPQLWYPNGIGEQTLYTVQVEVLSPAQEISDSRNIRFGIRTIRAVPNAGAPADALPYTLEINGRMMFVKGWNWAPVDNLYGRLQPERYERLLQLARHAHCNLLRVWGGGLLEREQFYDLCDKYGILIWQEFHQSSSGINNRPPEDNAYLDYIEKQARQMIPLRRNHPALAIWCGGNELMDDRHTPLSDAHPALAKLKQAVNELDPGRLWLPTSSSGPVEAGDIKLKGTGKMHDVHGSWQYQGPEEQYRFYNNIDALYHSEFGVEGAANLITIRRFISPHYQWPPDGTNPAWVHHGSWWLHRDKLERMFGPLETLETFVRASQWMQAEGLRYAIEANRRRKWQCSGVSPWQLNEAFPNAACTNAVDYIGLTKPAYWWVRRAYEPVHISAQYDRVVWETGSRFSAEIWCHNSLSRLAGAHWEARLCDLNGETIAHTGGAADLSGNASLHLGSLSHQLGELHAHYLLWLSLYSSDNTLLSRNEYLFAAGKDAFQGVLRTAPTTLSVRRQNDHVRLRNTGTVTAMFIQFIPTTGQWLLPSDDYFCMAPGEERTVQLEGHGRIDIQAWNTKAHRLFFPPLSRHKIGENKVEFVIV